jgi:hypothetical protein
VNRCLLSLALAALVLPLVVLTQPATQSFILTDVTAQSGVGFVHRASATSHKYLIESMSGGVAAFDYNNDGAVDLFFVNGAALRDPMSATDKPDKSAPEYWNGLYRNNRNGTFTDVTASAHLAGAGYGMGAATGDYDNDGFEDLYVTNLGRNTLYHNNGDGTFTDVTEQSGTGASGWSTGALFIDYDGDGLLDLIVTRYVQWSFMLDPWCGSHAPGHRAYCHPDQFQPISSVVFHNVGHGRFEDVSQKSGTAAHPGKGLGIAMNDFDHDGLPDVFVANDSFPEQLFRNNGNGTFTEVATERGAAYDADGRTFSGMGVDFADYDNDSWPDIFVNALARERYALFHNARGSFEYVSDSTGIARSSVTHSGWGAKFIDYDNDGWKDLFVGQGHVMDNIQLTQPEVHYLEPPLLLHNNHGRFNDVSATAGPVFTKSLAVRGAAFADLNNDGRVDIVLNCDNGPPLILRNTDANGNHWLIINAHGTRSNRDGIGAQIHITTASGLNEYAMVTTGGSYLSASDRRVAFGLGHDSVVNSLDVTWPSGTKQHIGTTKADQILEVTEPR